MIRGQSGECRKDKAYLKGKFTWDGVAWEGLVNVDSDSWVSTWNIKRIWINCVIVSLYGISVLLYAPGKLTVAGDVLPPPVICN